MSEIFNKSFAGFIFSTKILAEKVNYDYKTYVCKSLEYNLICEIWIMSKDWIIGHDWVVLVVMVMVVKVVMVVVVVKVMTVAMGMVVSKAIRRC